MKSTSGRLTPAIFFIVLVAALGYFVDIYDLVLFSIIRIKSLQGIGITNPSVTAVPRSAGMRSCRR